MTRRHWLASALVLAGCGRKKGSGFPGYAFVANEEARAVAAVDLTAFAVARHISLDAAPTAVVAHPRERTVYVLTPESGQLHEIDAANLKVRRSVRVAQMAHSIRLSPSNTEMWVACSNPRQLVRVRLEAMRPDGAAPLPDAPFDFDIAPDGKNAAVTFGAAGSLAMVDLESRTSRTYANGRNLERVRFRSDGRAILAGDVGTRALAILDAPSGRAIVNLPLAVRPDNFCVKSDGGQLFVTGEGMDAVVFVYPYNTEVAETVLAGKAPGAMAECLTPEANYLLVANPEAGDVSVVEIETRRVIAVAAVGRGPSCIGMTPDQQYALVLNRLSGDIAVIRIAAIAATRAKSAPLFTMIPVGSGPVSVAVRGV
jgi:YVTN family beta-propeller protein